MKKSYSIFFLGCLLHFPALIWAQYNDASLWVGVNVEKKLTGKTSLTFNPELRFNENITELSNAFLDLGVAHKLSKSFRVYANYRVSQRRRLDNTYGTRHRYYVDMSYRIKIDYVTIAYRLRLQQQYYQVGRSNNGYNPTNAIRNKILMKLDMEKRYVPFFSAEAWYEHSYRFSNFNRFRLSGGVDYELNKFSSITASYIFQRGFNEEDPRTDYIISLSYNYSF